MRNSVTDVDLAVSLTSSRKQHMTQQWRQDEPVAEAADEPEEISTADQDSKDLEARNLYLAKISLVMLVKFEATVADPHPEEAEASTVEPIKASRKSSQQDGHSSYRKCIVAG